MRFTRSCYSRQVFSWLHWTSGRGVGPGCNVWGSKLSNRSHRRCPTVRTWAISFGLPIGAHICMPDDQGRPGNVGESAYNVRKRVVNALRIDQASKLTSLAICAHFAYVGDSNALHLDTWLSSTLASMETRLL